jgi:hypothetical protein
VTRCGWRGLAAVGGFARRRRRDDRARIAPLDRAPRHADGDDWELVAPDRDPRHRSEWRIPRFSPRCGRRNSIPPYVRAAADHGGIVASPDRPTGGL